MKDMCHGYNIIQYCKHLVGLYKKQKCQPSKHCNQNIIRTQDAAMRGIQHGDHKPVWNPGCSSERNPTWWSQTGMEPRMQQWETSNIHTVTVTVEEACICIGWFLYVEIKVYSNSFCALSQCANVVQLTTLSCNIIYNTLHLHKLYNHYTCNMKIFTFI